MLLVDKIEYCTAQKQSTSLKNNQTDCIVIATNVFMLSVSYIHNTFRVSALICHIRIYPRYQ